MVDMRVHRASCLLHEMGGARMHCAESWVHSGETMGGINWELSPLLRVVVSPVAAPDARRPARVKPNDRAHGDHEQGR